MKISAFLAHLSPDTHIDRPAHFVCRHREPVEILMSPAFAFGALMPDASGYDQVRCMVTREIPKRALMASK